MAAQIPASPRWCLRGADQGHRPAGATGSEVPPRSLPRTRTFPWQHLPEEQFPKLSAPRPAGAEFQPRARRRPGSRLRRQRAGPRRAGRTEASRQPRRSRGPRAGGVEPAVSPGRSTLPLSSGPARRCPTTSFANLSRTWPNQARSTGAGLGFAAGSTTHRSPHLPRPAGAELRGRTRSQPSPPATAVAERG